MEDDDIIIKIVELDIEVFDQDDFEDEAASIIDEYCNRLEEMEGMVCADNPYPEEFQFMWTHKASILINDEMKRLSEIGRKYFGEEAVFSYPTTMWKEL